jgi:hypothetical protein
VTLRKLFFGRKFSAREIRWLVYLLILLTAAAWRFLPRPWHPAHIVETSRHKIFSTATQPQIHNTAHALELLYHAYSNRLHAVSGWGDNHPLLQVKLYKDRAEMRRINPALGWAEAFYQPPACRAYFSADEINP